MKKLITSLLGLGIFAMLTVPAFAVSLQVAENIVSSKNLADDAYMVAGNADIESDVFGDLYIIGGSVTINGTVHEDLVVIGGRVNVVGDVLGDLRSAGGQIAVYGNVGDDVLVGGGQVDIGIDSVIGGSVIAGAGILTIDGDVSEDIHGGLGMLILNGSVAGDVVVTVEDTMSISESAVIGGDLKYSGLLESTIPSGVVGGDVSFNKFERETVLETVTYMAFIQKLFSYLASLVLAFVFAFFFPVMMMKSASLTRENIFKCFGVGLLSAIVGVIGSLILMVTIVGIPLALIISAVLLIAFYLSKIFVAGWIASYYFSRGKKRKKLHRGVLFGLMVLVLLGYFLVSMIPFVGWFVNIVLFLIGVGAMVLTKLDYLMFMKSKKMV